MDNKINAYKIIGDTPSIYAEVDETRGKFTLTLLKDNETVKTVTNTDCGQIFNVPSPGIYTVSVSYSAEKYYSAEIYFSEEEFKNNKLKSSSPVPEPDMSKTQDPLLDDVDDFLITVKIKKGKKSTLDKLIKGKSELFGLAKSFINLPSFPEDHPVHQYEYYTLKTSLPYNDAYKKCLEMEKSQDIIYASVTSGMITATVYSAGNNTDSAAAPFSATPDFNHLQKYLDEPHGMNIRNAWARGNTGKLASVRHIDFGVNEKHEDLQSGNVTIVVNPPNSLESQHGTASVGTISAADNGFGMTGMAHSAKVYTYYANQPEHKNIMNDAKPGDIISVDAGRRYNNNDVPCTVAKDFWDTVNNMTKKGAIVILAACNSGIDLSKPSNFMDHGDCGGIFVGACDPATGRRASFSNYGHSTSLVNSWGYNIATTGYGNLYKRGNDTTTMYTDSYNGTSGATPLCAGALALLQSHAKSMGVMLNAQSMRKLLSKSTYTEGVPDGIGVRPNVAQLMHELDKEILAPQAGVNPFPHESGYHNLLVSLDREQYKEENIPFFYQYTDMPSNAFACYYKEQGPADLVWLDYNVTPVKIPVIDSTGKISVLYLKISKWNNAGLLSMNTGAYTSTDHGNFRMRLIYDPKDNTHLNKNTYSGIFSAYVTSWHYNRKYKLPLRINIQIK